MCYIIYFLGKYTKKVNSGEIIEGFLERFFILLQMKTLCR